MVPRRFSRGIVIALSSLLSIMGAGCALDPSSGIGPPTASRDGATPEPGASAANPGVTPAPVALSNDPMLVTVDTDRTLSASPGLGIGVYIEYGTNGAWHVWWTCDAAAARRGVTECMFDLDVSSSSELDDAVYQAEGTQGPQAIDTATPHDFKANTTTIGDEVSGVRFTSDPGATIRLTLQIDGKNVAPFFFVADGEVNGGSTAPLTDPLLVRGATP